MSYALLKLLIFITQVLLHNNVLPVKILVQPSHLNVVRITRLILYIYIIVEFAWSTISRGVCLFLTRLLQYYLRAMTGLHWEPYSIIPREQLRMCMPSLRVISISLRGGAWCTVPLRSGMWRTVSLCCGTWCTVSLRCGTWCAVPLRIVWWHVSCWTIMMSTWIRSFWYKI